MNDVDLQNPNENKNTTTMDDVRRGTVPNRRRRGQASNQQQQVAVDRYADEEKLHTGKTNVDRSATTTTTTTTVSRALFLVESLIHGLRLDHWCLVGVVLWSVVILVMGFQRSIDDTTTTTMHRLPRCRPERCAHVRVARFDWKQHQQQERLKDVGGWQHPLPSPVKPLNLSSSSQQQQQQAPMTVDFGGLAIGKLKPSRFGRTFNEKEDQQKYNRAKQLQLEEMDQFHLSSKHYHDDELDIKECQRPNWRSFYFPNCNSFHEMDLSRSHNDPHLLMAVRDPNYDGERFRYVWGKERLCVDGFSVHPLAFLRCSHTTRFSNNKKIVAMDTIGTHGCCTTLDWTKQPLPRHCA